MEGCQAIGLIKIIQGMLQRRGKNGARVSESGSEKGGGQDRRNMNKD